MVPSSQELRYGRQMQYLQSQVLQSPSGPESEVTSTLPDEGTIASAPATAPQPVPPGASAAASAPDSPSQSDGSFDDLFDEPENNTQGSSTQNKSQTTANGAAGLAVPPPAQPQQPPRPNFGSIAPSKNAPPLLDPDTYMKFSPDILLTASIDGQVILWDKRVNTPGTGVGRLWMNEKTPPWCLSVRMLCLSRNVLVFDILFRHRHAGLRTAAKYMPEGVTGPLTSGMYASLVVRVLLPPPGF